ncbi:uncharacterized protein GLRG_00325 [Colletotrichum graminicola M1.001]|uniref:Uncharacterized protein n=1 Tax=Colletotrichum graminicola (strain M1.001 / M2 / FGSC 10212) TaxID=645133 RepID=E3Q280_COLGM|nr:uncharacterized protein GLRG_00325 [Colletotrichum graminicola M1.001]EFQ25181.1 hypothetical protein GLRG_00325 [Colletotrichum graminicola M1.001]
MWPNQCFQMMEDNEASNALLTQAADRLDAATNALMKEKDEFALAKEQLLEKGTQFASINVELEKAMAAVEQLVAIQCNNFANYDNSLNITPTSGAFSGMGIFDPQEIASFQMELDKEKDELEAVKIALNDAFSDINLVQEEPDVNQNGAKGDGQYVLEQKIPASDYTNTNGTIDTQAKEREELKASIIEELKKELKTQLKAEIKNKLKNKLKAKLKADIMTELKADIMTELKAELKGELIKHMKSNIKHEFIKHEIKDAVSHEIAGCINPSLVSEIYKEMREALKRINDREEELETSFDNVYHRLYDNEAEFQMTFDNALRRLNEQSEELEKKKAGEMKEKLRRIDYKEEEPQMNFDDKLHRAKVDIEKLAKNMADDRDGNSGTRAVQMWNETRDKKRQAKKSARKESAIVPVPLPLRSNVKSEGSIVGRCVAANACDWGAWGAETPASESAQEKSYGAWGERPTAKAKKAESSAWW